MNFKQPLLCRINPDESTPRVYAELFTPITSEYDGFIMPVNEDFRHQLHQELDRFLDKSPRLLFDDEFCITIRELLG